MNSYHELYISFFTLCTACRMYAQEIVSMWLLQIHNLSFSLPFFFFFFQNSRKKIRFFYFKQILPFFLYNSENWLSNRSKKAFGVMFCGGLPKFRFCVIDFRAMAGGLSSCFWVKKKRNEKISQKKLVQLRMRRLSLCKEFGFD